MVGERLDSVAVFGSRRKRAVEKFKAFVVAGKSAGSIWRQKVHPVIPGELEFVESICQEHHA